MRRLLPIVLSCLTAAAPASAQDVEDPLYQPAEHALPMSFEGGHPRIELALAQAGRALTFVVDTGAGASVVNLPLARKLDILQANAGHLDVSGASGDVAGMPLTRALPFRAGTLSWTGVMLAADLSRLSSQAQHPIDGIFGMDMLHWFDMDLDISGRQLTLRKDGGPLGPGCMPNVAPQDDSPSAALVFAPITLGNETASIQATALIDTGAAYTIINAAAAKALGLDLTGKDARLRDAGQTQGLSGAGVQAWFYEVPTIKIGAWTPSTHQVLISPMSAFGLPGLNQGPAVILGADLLQHARLRITRNAEAICISPSPARSEPKKS